MASTYSFLDIVVLDEVRERFAAGEALAVLSAGLDDILWVNGAGAAWLGFADIEAAIGEKPRLPATTLRQIAATPGFPRIGRDRTVGLRLTAGLKSRIVTAQASAMALPRGEEALLLALPASPAEEAQPGEQARRIIAGFEGPGHFAALVEADGTVAAASTGFEDLGIVRETLQTLIQDVGSDRDRLTKRLIAGARGRLPAGIARLTDEPARHLLVVVDEGTTEAPAEGEDTTSPVNPVVAARQTDTEATAADARPEIAQTSVLKSVSESAERVPEAAPVAAEVQSDQRPASGTVRFSWRTDSEGRFSAISQEFAEAMGEHAADVIGRTFREVSNAFGLDPSGAIARLLERRDTWSGRTVMWPLAGTNLKVPVDLAALPVYGRGRVFEGFRGFGIARLGEAEVDVEAIGTVLTSPQAESAQQEPMEVAAPPAEPEEELAPVPAPEADPFLGEKPALRISQPSELPSEKVIRLAEHREGGWNSSLTASERTAFREIGERLRRANEAPLDRPGRTGDPAAQESEEPQETTVSDEAALTGDIASSEEFEPAAQQVGHENVRSDEPQPLSAEMKGEAAETQDEPRHRAVQQTEEASEAPEVRPAAEIEAPQSPTEPEHLHDPEEIGPLAAEQERIEPETTDEPLLQEPQSGDTAAASDTPSEEAPTEPERPHLQDFVPSVPHPAADQQATNDSSILANLPLPILIHSGDRLHYANREFLKLTGYEDLASLETAGGIGALFQEPSATEWTRSERLRLRKADGTEMPVEAHLQSVAWQGGKALMLALQPFSHEPTPEEAAKAAELEARLSEMRAIVDTATDGIAVIGNDGTIRSINRPAEALFGFDAENITDRPFTSLFAIESQRTVQDYLTALSDNGVASVLNDGRQVIGREAQGRFIPLFITIGRLPNGSGYCAVLRDITQWKRAEEELMQARAQAERASSQKSDFLARVSHEIRTPLNAIIGFSELMIDEKFGPIGNERYRDYLRDINRSGNHVLDLVNDLLDISKIEAGQQEMAYEAVSLNDTLGQVVAMLQPQANSERVIIRSSFASRLPDIVADLRSVRQIAINLLSNAVRYTPAGGQVIVSTAYERDGSVVLRVRDTGVGMSSAELEEALKPFKQINALRRKRGDGTGLGLPLTRAMVEANRAQFSIASTPGEGTLVEISFPPTRVLAS